MSITDTPRPPAADRQRGPRPFAHQEVGAAVRAGARSGTTNTIMIIDDHDLIAQGLTHALRSEGIEVIQERVPDPASVVPIARWHNVGLALVDLQFGSDAHDGMILIEPLTRGGVGVLVLTGSTDRSVLGACLEAGALGVASKAGSFESLLASIGAALRGEQVNSLREREELLGAARQRRAEERRREEPFLALTPREAEVLCYLARGFAADAIAEATYVSVATVRTHIAAILRKLGVKSQLAAVALVREAGWAFGVTA